MQGLEAGVHRQLIFTGLRVGLYGSLLDFYSGHAPRDEAHLSTRVCAAMTTSALGITLANPSGAPTI
jgi:solute carrier family 25 (mitochondrial uncoupling protein), member 8/9